MRKICYGLGLVVVFACTFFMTQVSYRGTSRSSPRERETHGRSDALEALEFWSASRSYPEKDFPGDKYYKAFESARRTFRKEQPRPDAISAWQSIGPVNLSGRAISIAVDPQHTSTIYVGSASGGLWRSNTGGLGSDWQRISTGYPVLGVGAIAIDPTNSDILYIGTGEVYRSQIALGGLVVRTTRGSFGMGILKTTDRGLTWTKSLDWTTQMQQGIQAMKINPLNPHTIFAATTIGLYKTTDAGATWNPNLYTVMGEDILINPLDTNQVIYSSGNFGASAGVYRSTDAGTSWNEITDLPLFTGKTMLAMYEANPNVVYADVADSTTGVGSMWRSTDFGLSWTTMGASGIYGVQGWYSHYIAPHPVDANKIFHASVGIEKSTNGGVSFAAAGGGGYPDNHAYAVDPSNPDVLYTANDDGVYRSTDFGSTFTYVGYNLVTGQFYNGFSNSSTDSLLAIGQVQDHIPGYLYWGSTLWARSASDEVGWTAIDQTNDNTMYTISRNGSTLSKSTNRGLSFSARASFPTFGAWNSPFVVSTSSPNVIYVGQTKIFKSTNGATTFSATNANLALDNNPALCMALSATSPDTVFVGTAPYTTRSNIFRTTNGGTAWSNVTGPLPNRYALDINLDPRDSRIAYVTFGGFSSGHVFKSTDAGSSWSDISGTLPDVPTGAVLVDPANSNYVYVGNDIGVYASTNGGTSWLAFSEGLPEAILVSDLTYTPSNRTLRATTHGNGVFERKLDQTLPAITLTSPNGGEQVEAGVPYLISWASGLVDQVRIEYTPNDGTNWLPIAEHLPSTPGSYVWVPMKTLTTQARIRITSDADESVADQSDSVFTIFFDGVITPVRPGWNLMSLPVLPADPRRTALFPTATSSVFTYKDGYVKRDSLQTGLGYWVKFGQDQSISLKGTTYTAMTVDVVEGWNMIGTLSVPIPVSQITVDPPGVVRGGYVAHDGRYVFVTTLLPALGYWVKAIGSGQLTLVSSAVAKSPDENPYDDLKGFNQITVSDDNGSSQTLYFSVGDRRSLINKYELPLPPPGDGFDVRFASNQLAELLPAEASGRAEIRLQAPVYPIMIEWRINDPDEGYGLTFGKDRHRDIGGGGSMRVDGTDGSSMFLTHRNDEPGEAPLEFFLAQNYPNPFNPATDIRYRIAERSQVKMEIIDVLGKVNGTLVDEIREAGEYVVSWDASAFPSGIYVYRLTAGRFVQSRKLLLVK